MISIYLDGLYTGIAKYNGNHYFSGDEVKGKAYRRGDKLFILDLWIDHFDNEYTAEVEITESSLGLAQ